MRRISDQIQVVKELCWSEKELPQKERTKHVHSIHQYMGKYVPQLVDYFLERDLKHSKIILDPFVGSGTTLIQSNFHSISSIGIDLSQFNVMLSNVKIAKYDISILEKEINDILSKTLADKNNKKIPKTSSSYLKKWYAKDALLPLLTFRDLISDYKYQNVLKVILSRAARSSRMTSHFELDFPRKPQTEDYYCHKHSRICHPTTNAKIFIKRYCRDVLERITQFQKIRKNVYTRAFRADSRTFDFSKQEQKIDGVITSPPYVGLIDYHEQHRYAYELLGLKDNSKKEIGIKTKGNGRKATEIYKTNISKVFKNIADNALDQKKGKIIIVVNDRLNLYDDIVNDAGLKITNRLHRRVDRRTGRRATSFYESILICKNKN